MKVGIDLGTTFSVVAKYDPSISDASVILNKEGLELTPSVLCFENSASPLAGWAAHTRLLQNGPECVTDFKKTLGMETKYRLGGKEYYSSDLYSILYRHLAATAEEVAGEPIESAIITVPAYFNDIQRNAAKNAAISAGIPDVRVMNEPTAAAIAYGYRRTNRQTIMVYDLGGGTIDVTVCRVGDRTIEVVGTAGNHLLGGDNWNAALLDFVCERFEADFGINPGDDSAVREMLLDRADAYKKLLSTQESVDYEIEYAGEKQTYRVTREDFETATSHLMVATMDVIDEVTVDGERLDPASVDEVILVGGSTRMPYIRRYLAEHGFDNVVELDPEEVDTAVAKGAALAAALLNNRETGLTELTVSDSTSISLGLLTESNDGEHYYNTILIPKGSKIPVSCTGHLRIRENNVTDHLDVYVLQGESQAPTDCTVLAKRTVTGFENPGTGMVFDITLSYDKEGIVNVTAKHGDTELTVIKNDAVSDMAWMHFSPRNQTMDSNIGSIAKEVVFIADLSRSMWPHIDKVKECIRNLAEKLNGETTTFTLMGFADRTRLECGPGAPLEEFMGSVDRIKTGFLSRYGTGTAADPLEDLLDMSPSMKGATFAIVITDGVWESRNHAVNSARDLREEKRIVLFTVCYGDNPDRSFIKQLSDMDADSIFTTVDNLKNVTDTIAIAVRNKATGLREMH